MDIEYGMVVVDKNNQTLGTVNQVILDTWSGEPRKFVVRQEESAFFFTPQQVAKATKEKVTLNISAQELEQT